MWCLLRFEQVISKQVGIRNKYKILTLTRLVLCFYNCLGLGDREKRNDVLNYLTCKHFDIYCLQDTHFTNELEPYIQTQWGYKCIFNSFTSSSRGVVVMLNNSFEYKLYESKIDNSGNFIALDITIKEKRITLINIYGPNNDNQQFFLNILKCIEEFENDEYLICGDFNLVLSQDLDTKIYLHINHLKAQKEYIETYDMKYPFRELYPALKRYTWRKSNPLKLARLDMFMEKKFPHFQ